MCYASTGREIMNQLIFVSAYSEWLKYLVCTDNDHSLAADNAGLLDNGHSLAADNAGLLDNGQVQEAAGRVRDVRALCDV